MAPRGFTVAEFTTLCETQGWTRLSTFALVEDARTFLTAPTTRWAARPATQQELKDVLAQASAIGAAVRPEHLAVGVHRRARQGALSLANAQNATVQVWFFEAGPAETLECLQRLADLARRGQGECRLDLVRQEDVSFMWRSSLVHPMQVRENVHQRLVHAVDRTPVVDPLTVKGEVLGRFFQQGDAPASPLVGHRPDTDPADPAAGAPRWAAVRMNHLIDTFYLFRLLIRFQASAPGEVSEELRINLSGALTKLLHSGDPARMGWLTVWLAEKVADLGKRVNALNGAGPRRVLFFLKGGRALNYYLGTPEKGENDWDTQVVIDPRLPAEEWYGLLAQVHDTVLVALDEYADEFTALVEKNAPEFGDYLAGIEEAPSLVGDERAENEVADVTSRQGRASCKAELIDVGLPRRGTPAALEEWNHLSPEGAILDAGGVLFPHRPYYVNEYLMMVREAFRPDADVHKAPKRIVRLAKLLNSPGADLAAMRAQYVTVLPRTAALIDATPSQACREVWATAASQCVQAYALAQDTGLAAAVDTWGAELLGRPGAIPGPLASVVATLGEGEQELARAVGAGHALSERIQAHAQLRSAFVRDQKGPLGAVLKAVNAAVESALEASRLTEPQFAVVGAEAARRHAAHLRLDVDGLEPVRRIVAHVQHPVTRAEGEVMAAVRDAVVEAATAGGHLTLVDPGGAGNGRSLSFSWSADVEFSDGAKYKPLVFKVRAAAHTGAQGVLPVVTQIDGLPVLDLRFLADDYLRKSAKTHEIGMQGTLRKASEAVEALMSQFDVSLVQPVDPADG